MNVVASERTSPTPLIEEYVLDPHRTTKSSFQWQFGIVAPRGPEAESALHSFMETVCLLEAEGRAHLTIRLRFLQLRQRSVEEIDPALGQTRNVPRLEVDGQDLVAWEQGILHTKTAELSLQAGQPASVLLVEAPGDRKIEHIADGEGVMRARCVCESSPLDGQMRLHVRPLENYLQVRIRFENLAPWETQFAHDRSALLRRSFVGAHLVVAARGARFVSLLEPPAPAAAAAASCRSTHVHPVLVGSAGRRDIMLSSPLLLNDYPDIGQLEANDDGDAPDIDEALSLRLISRPDWK